MDGVTLQRQARALGDPTRHAIFRAVADAIDTVDVASLTERFGLNHNAVRQHLAKLVDAGLVNEATLPPAGRGRPKLVYRVDAEVDGRWGVTGPYERLALLLSEVIRSGETAVEVGRRAGRAGRGAAVAAATDPVEGLVQAMAEQGFRPTFASTAAVDPETVCALHRGLADGVAELLPGVHVDGLEVVPDPRRGGCRLTGTGSSGGQDAPSGSGCGRSTPS